MAKESRKVPRKGSTDKNGRTTQPHRTTVALDVVDQNAGASAGGHVELPANVLAPRQLTWAEAVHIVNHPDDYDTDIYTEADNRHEYIRDTFYEHARAALADANLPDGSEDSWSEDALGSGSLRYKDTEVDVDLIFDDDADEAEIRRVVEEAAKKFRAEVRQARAEEATDWLLELDQHTSGAREPLSYWESQDIAEQLAAGSRFPVTYRIETAGEGAQRVVTGVFASANLPADRGDVRAVNVEVPTGNGMGDIAGMRGLDLEELVSGPNSAVDTNPLEARGLVAETKTVQHFAAQPNRPETTLVQYIVRLAD